MTFWKLKNTIEPKYNFYTEINQYYFGVSENRIPSDLLNQIVDIITDKIYSDYKKFWTQYPKSRKRYSKFKIEDIEHPFVHYAITDFLKEKKVIKYRYFSKILLKMDDLEFDKYAKTKHKPIYNS